MPKRSKQQVEWIQSVVFAHGAQVQGNVHEFTVADKLPGNFSRVREGIQIASCHFLQ